MKMRVSVSCGLPPLQLTRIWGGGHGGMVTMSASGCTAGEQSFNECFSLLRLVVRDPDHGAALTCQEESRMPR